MPKAKAKLTSHVQRVYSYIRYSTPEQKLGDSERRQLNAAKRWAEKKGYEFDESLKDEGLSGYSGANRTKGHLGHFLDRVKTGDVPRDSILVVEDIDRLSREEVVSALKTLIFDLVEHDITIQTLGRSEMTYNRASLNGYAIYVLVGEIQRAHHESELKSERVGEARKRQREEARKGKTLTRQLPAWIRATDDARRIPIPEAAKTIQLIFDLKLKGLGSRAIEAKLNKSAPWTPPKNPKRKTGGWRASYIKKILSNRAVIGEYQPHVLRGGRGGKRVPIDEPILDYFPKIIAPEVFHAVQRGLESNRGKGGRNGKVRNLLRHLVKCAYCGGPMAVEDKGKPPKGAIYLVCDSGRRGVGCARHRIRYDECEKALLENCHRLRPEHVLPKPGEQAEICRSLRQRIQGKLGQLDVIEQQLNNLTDQVTRTASLAARDRYEAKLVELDELKRDLDTQKEQDQKELAKAEMGVQSFTAWKTNLESLRKALKSDDAELRLRLQAHLREFIDKIEVFAIGHHQVFDPDAKEKQSLKRAVNRTKSGKPISSARAIAAVAIDAEDLAEAIRSGISDVAPAAFARSKEFHEFLNYVTERRMSKVGRFLRVHFKTGAIVDIVPEGSLASGSKLIEAERGKKKWRFVKPSMDRLWQEFSTRNRRKLPDRLVAKWKNCSL